MTVFQILKKKGIENFQADPLFVHAQQSGWLTSVRKKETPFTKNQGERLVRLVEGMWCGSCALAIEWLLEEIPGVLFCSVDYSTDLIVLRFDPLKTNLHRIDQVLQKWGYSLVDPLGYEKRKLSDFFTWKIALMAFLGMNTMMLSYPAYLAYLGVDTQGYEWICSLTSGFLSVALIPLALWPLAKSSFLALSAGIMGAELLIGLASFSALVLSFWRLFEGSSHVYFDTAWVLLGLHLLGKGLEKSFKLKAQDSVLGTLNMTESKVRVPTQTGWSFIAAKDLKEGDSIGFVAGDMARVEAVIETGTLYVDLSWERGEALASALSKGDTVRSGMVITSGSAVAKVVTCASQSQLQIWLNQLAFALEKRKQKQGKDGVSFYLACFTGVILFLSLFSAIWALAHDKSVAQAFETAMSVLVISCPCSLGIAVPLARARLFSKITELGFWVRQPQHLETAADIRTWVLDKTGTLTHGKMKLVDMPLQDPFQLKCLKALSLHSNHPLCKSIQHYLSEVSCQDIELVGVSETLGVGLKGYINDEEIYLGRPSQYLDRYVSCEFKIGGQTLALLSFEDPLREEAGLFVRQLEQPILLSGDHAKRCEAAAYSVGIERVYSEKNSLEKASWIKNWKQQHPNEKIALIGDGLNDALAMQESDFSIAIASDRSDPTSALHWADMAFVKDDLNAIIELIECCKKTKIVSRQNIFLGFFYNLILVPIAFWGYLSPIHAAIAMLLNSISILVNSIRV